MKKWIEEHEEKDLQIMCDTLRYLVKSEQTPQYTKQHAILFLNEIEDHLWDNVCKGIPAEIEEKP